MQNLLVERKSVDQGTLLLAHLLVDFLGAVTELIFQTSLERLESVLDHGVIMGGRGNGNRVLLRGHSIRNGTLDQTTEIVHALTLQANSQEDGLLNARKADLAAEAVGEVVLGDGGNHIQDNVVVEEVVRIAVQTLQIERREGSVEVALLNSAHNGRGIELGTRGKETAVEVAREGAQPASIGGARTQSAQHDAGMLTGQLVSSLTQVYRMEIRALPELVQSRGQAVTDAEVVQRIRATLAQLAEQGRHGANIADMDIVIEQARVSELLVSDPNHLLLGTSHVLVETGELALVEIGEKFQGTGTITHANILGVRSDTNDASSRKTRKVLVLELLGHQPGDQITTGTLATAQAVQNTLSADATFEGNLNHAKRLWKLGSLFINGWNKHIELMGGGIAHELEVICAAVGNVGVGSFDTAAGLFSKLLDQLQRERSTSSLITIDGGGHEDEIRTHQLAHKRERNGSRLINDQEFCLAQDVRILGLNVLNSLTVVAMNVDTHDSLVEIWVGRLQDSSLQVLGARRGNENVAIAMGNGRSNGNTKGSRLSSSTASRKSNRASQGLFRNCVHKGKESLGLINRTSQAQQWTNGLRLCQAVLDFLQFLLGAGARIVGGLGRREGFDMLAARDGQHVQLVVHDQARIAAAQRQDKALVETGNHIIVGLSAVTGVDIHGQGVQLLQAVHALQQQQNHTTTLDGLNMEMHDHIFRPVSNDHKEAALLLLHTISDEGRDTRVDRFARHVGDAELAASVVGL
ncbi:hypothetical protein F1880_004952 [Penicillium rolfsii]|nr:hypothetical protein F1880_004952 [Penicillium rolfsii]